MPWDRELVLGSSVLASPQMFDGSHGRFEFLFAEIFIRHTQMLDQETKRQMLGNFEYRIPIFGRTVSGAFFVDAGTAFSGAVTASGWASSST